MEEGIHGEQGSYGELDHPDGAFSIDGLGPPRRREDHRLARARASAQAVNYKLRDVLF